MMRMAMAIAAVSLPCYMLIRKFMVLPSYTTLFNSFRSEMRLQAGFLTTRDKLAAMLTEWTKREGERKKLIEDLGGILAIDAVSLRPHVVVTEQGLVEGLLDQEVISNSQLAEFHQSYAKYEQFVKSIKNKTITDSFVYYYQPLASEVPCQTILIDPSTQGKATAKEIDMLGSLAEELDGFGFPVKGFAFDGDSTYSKLHRTFFESYYVNVTTNVSFESFGVTERMIISDPLHLLKRGRYRFLSARVHSGFERTNCSLIAVDEFRKHVDLPSLVFNPEKYTKMHDDLATQLFSLKTLSQLIKARDDSALAYFTPLCLLTSALEEGGLTVEERIFFLEIGFYYMLAYFGISSETHSQLKQTKTKKDLDVRPFDLSYTREYCNTVYSLLSVLKNCNGTIALNRVGTNPVEHLFGLVRMKSKSVHTYDKMVQVLSKVALSQRLLSELGVNSRVDQRRSYFAQTVRVETETNRRHKTDTRDIAFALHCKFGLPISVKQLMVWDAFSTFELANEISDNLGKVIISTEARCHRDDKKRGLSSTSIKSTTGAQILPRIVDRNAVE